MRVQIVFASGCFYTKIRNEDIMGFNVNLMSYYDTKQNNLDTEISRNILELQLNITLLNFSKYKKTFIYATYHILM